MERSKMKLKLMQMMLFQEQEGKLQKLCKQQKLINKKLLLKQKVKLADLYLFMNEYAKAKEVTQERMYLETMEKVLADIDKVIIEKNAGSGVVPYLPLPELGKKKASN